APRQWAERDHHDRARARPGRRGRGGGEGGGRRGARAAERARGAPGRVRRPGPRPVAHALDALTGALAPPTLLAEVQRAWPAAAGPMFADRARPVRERDGEVTVACGEAVLAQELDLLSELVRKQLNDALGRP